MKLAADLVEITLDLPDYELIAQCFAIAGKREQAKTQMIQVHGVITGSGHTVHW